MKIMERRYVSKNGVIERTRYAVGDNAVPRKKKNRGTTSYRKQEQNFNSALRKVARILNCNYSHENGLLLTLDLDEAGLSKLVSGLPQEQQRAIRELKAPVGEIGTWNAKAKKLRNITMDADAEVVLAALQALRDAMSHQMTLWLRRVKRKHQGKMKALMVTSDLDHETGELVRVHNHIVLAAEDISWDLLQKEWKLGSVDIKQLRNQPDYTPIAVYLMRQVRRQPDEKKYRVTRGMELPETTESLVLSHAEIKAPAGARVLERGCYSADTIAQYIRYIPKKQGRRKHDEFSEIQRDPP